MTEPAALYRLFAWLSPSFPVGAYAYSQGIEWAVEEGTIRDRETLQDWIRFILFQGGGRNERGFCRRGPRRAICSPHLTLAARDRPRLRAETVGPG